MKKLSFLPIILLTFGFLFFSSCSEKSEIQPKSTTINPSSKKVASTTSNGKIRLKIKGTSTSQFYAAGAYLDLVELKTVGKPGQAGKFITIWDIEETFNLLNMSGGIMVDIGFLPIPSGTYSEARCHVYGGWVQKVQNGPIFYCNFPGEKMTLHFNPAVIVGEHLSADLELTIDVGNSFKPQGNPNNPTGYTFKPIVNVANTTSNGTLAVAVINDSYAPVNDATVTLNVNGINLPVTYAYDGLIPDGQGGSLSASFYFLPGIPAGNYSGQVIKTGYSPHPYSVTILKGNYNSAFAQLTSIP